MTGRRGMRNHDTRRGPDGIRPTLRDMGVDSRRAGARPSARSPEGGRRALLRARLHAPARSTSRAASGWTTRARERFGELARDAGIALSVHAPLAGFLGHVERDKKHRMAIGMLDHSAGVAAACGAELVVIHPGFLLGRDARGRARRRRRAARRAARAPRGQGRAGAVRRRGDGPRPRARHRRGRRSRSPRQLRLGAAGDRLRPPARASPTAASPTIEPFHGVLDDRRRDPRARRAVPHPLQRHRSSRTGTRRSTCPTARARCAPSRCAEALAKFKRPATVISESPDEASSQAIRSILLAKA